MSRPIAPLFLLATISLLTILIMSQFFGGFGSGFAGFMLSLTLRCL
jgi:hypothetical protein